MRISRWTVAVVLVATACTAETPIIDPTGTPSISPTPAVTKRPAVRAVRAAVVHDGTVVVYDPVADTTMDVATAAGVRGLRWIDRDTLAIVQEGSGVTVVQSMDVESRAVRELGRVDGSLLAFDLSADGAVLAALVSRGGDPVLEIRYLSGDQAVLRSATIPQVGRGVSLDDEIRLAFSPSGALLLLTDTAAASSEDPERSHLQIRRLDGSLAFDVSGSRAPTMARWLRDESVVFRSADGIRRWRPGGSSSTGIADLGAFYNPSVSPNGRSIAFDTGARNVRVQARRLDLATGEVTDVGPPGRFRPIYAAGDAIWTQIANRCTPGCDQPVVGGPEVFSFNPVDGKERLLRLPTLEMIALAYA